MRVQAWLLLLALAFLPDLRAQVVVEEVGVLQDQFLKAQQAFQASDPKKAVASLDPLLATLDRWEQSGRLQPSDENLLLNALELRGICRFTLKEGDLAQEDFARLIRLRPEREITLTGAAKILKLYEDLRQQQTGTLALSVDPPAAQLSVDGRVLGSNYPKDLPLLKGLHHLRWTLPGYDPVEKEVVAEAGTTVPLQVQLAPNARTVYFLVQPKGTRLYLGKKLLGTADKPAASQEDFARFARERGADPASTFVISAQNLPPGEHRVTLSRECYETQEFMVTVALDRSRSVPGLTRPVILQPRSVDFEVSSQPSGASLAVDGRDMGKTPVVLKDFCVGEHEFHLSKPGAGEYRVRIQVTEEGPFSLRASLRPSLFWAGLTRDQETSPEQFRAVEESLAAALARLQRFNTVPSREANPMLPDTFFAGGVEEAERQETARDLCLENHCQGLLSARLERAGGGASLELRLVVPGVSGFDSLRLPIRSPLEIPTLLEALDEPISPSAPPCPLRLANIPGAPGPTVLRSGGEGGPAPGDVVVRVGLRSVGTAGEACEAMAGAAADEVLLRRKGQEYAWTPAPAAGHPVSAFGGASYPYRRLLLLARQAAAVSEGGAAARQALLTLAMASLSLDLVPDALEALDRLQPPGEGEEGTSAADYLRAVALVRRGSLEEARQHLLAVAGDPEAALDAGADILLQPLALDLLHQIPTPGASEIPLPAAPGGLQE